HGMDTITVGSGDSTIDHLAGPLTIDGGTSTNTLILDDSKHKADENWTITATAVQRGASLSIAYAGITTLNLTTGRGTDTVAVLSTSAATNVSTSAGRDRVNVGDGGSVQGILGDVTITNPSSFSTLTVDGSADPQSRTVTLDTFTPFAATGL